MAGDADINARVALVSGLMRGGLDLIHDTLAQGDVLGAQRYITALADRVDKIMAGELAAQDMPRQEER